MTRVEMPRGARRAAAFVFVVTLLAGCTGNEPGGPTTGPPKPGGSLVLGAERWPDCLNPITSCSADQWTWWTVLQNVLPRAMELDLDGNFVASPLLVEAPSLANGLITADPFSITYRIDPHAVWDDGTPITSADFEFTWRAIMSTTGALITAGYDLIESIDTSDPRTAVIAFRETYVQWPDLFGGTWQGLIKKSAFPTADTEAPDLKEVMLDSIAFSGGPWKLDSWSTTEAVLSRNDRYWVADQVPILDSVSFVPLQDIVTEVNALLNGEVSAIYPSPNENVGLDDLLKREGVKGATADNNFVVALWFNHAMAPLDDGRVREVVMRAVDRQAIVEEVVRIKNPDAEVNGCGLVSFPNFGPWCDSEVFDAFTYDPEAALGLLESAGYDCSGVPTQPCTRQGHPLEIQLSTISTNPQFLAAAAIIKRSAREAGIDVEINEYDDPGVFFGEDGPMGRFAMALYADGGRTDPSVTALMTCDQIPTAENGFTGFNWNHWCSAEADALMRQSDREIDPAKRLELMSRIYELQARDRVSLPLYTLPSVSGWRGDRISGPVGAYTGHPIYGLFFNMNEWSVP